MSRSVCALLGVLLCFFVVRPCIAQEPVQVCRLDSGCLSVLELLSHVTRVLVIDESRSLFDRAERLQKAGKLDEARIAYQEVHLASPTSVYGQKAMERINTIETMLRNSSITIPLGTVDDLY